MKKSLKKLFAVSALSVMTIATLTGCGGGAWDDASTISVISREDGSGTRGAFVELLGIEQEDASGEKVDMTTIDAQISNSTSVVLTTVEGDEYSIGYVSLGSLNDTVKALKVGGVEATAENILSGDYTIARPFNLAVKEGSENPIADDFIGYILSEEGQAIVEENGFVPLAETQDYTPAAVSGTLVVGGSTSVSPVMEKLVEAYNAINADVEIEIQASGSTAGMEGALAGTYDIGMASREIKDSEIASGLKGVVMAMDGIAIVVNTANPMEDITAEMVKNIFMGEITTWADAAK